MWHDPSSGTVTNNGAQQTFRAGKGDDDGARMRPSGESAEVVVEGWVFPVRGDGPWTIGRSESNDVLIPDVHVSRRHARISLEGDGFVVEDLSSSNGTMLGGAPIEREIVEDGGEIEVAGVAVRLVRRTQPDEPPAEASPEAKPEATDGARLPDLPGIDGLRALAVIAVLLYNAGLLWLPGGFLGVEVFFVISGYLITALLLAEWRSTGRIELKAFWLRRARRLLPALYVMLAVTLAYCLVFLPEEVAGLRGDVLAALGYVINWYLIFSQESYFEVVGRPSLLKHLWSLAIEEQFYLLWPMFLVAGMAIWGQVQRRLIVLALIVAGAGASSLLMAVLYDPGVDPSRLYFGTDTRASGLLLGAALAFVWWPGRFRGEGGRRLPLVLDLICLASLGGLFVFCLLLGEYQPSLYRGGFAAVGLVTVILIAVVVHPRARFGPRVLGWGPLRWVGLRSYSIYLWHWPVFMVSRPQLDVPFSGTWPVAAQLAVLVAAQLAVTVALADLSYRFVETPIRRGALGRAWRSWREATGLRRWWLGLRWGTAATACVVSCVALGVAVALAEQPKPPSYLTTKEVHTKTPSLGEEPVQQAPQSAGRNTQETKAAIETAPAGVIAEAPAEAPAEGPVSAVGDSVMVGAADGLQENVGQIGIDAQVGLQVQSAIGILQRREAEGRLAETVVIHVGNNGPLSAVYLDEIMRIVGEERLVVLVNDRVPRSWEQPNNELLADAAQRYPNAVLANWYSASAGRPELFWSDGMHLRPAGAQAYSRLIQRRIESF